MESKLYFAIGKSFFFPVAISVIGFVFSKLRFSCREVMRILVQKKPELSELRFSKPHSAQSLCRVLVLMDMLPMLDFAVERQIRQMFVSSG